MNEVFNFSKLKQLSIKGPAYMLLLRLQKGKRNVLCFIVLLPDYIYLLKMNNVNIWLAPY